MSANDSQYCLTILLKPWDYCTKKYLGFLEK
jgi:hypothetical protein